MALKLNKELTTKSGLKIPVDNVIISGIHFPPAIVSMDKDDENVYTRRVTYDLLNYISEGAVIEVGDNYVSGGCVDFKSGYERIMTPAEYLAILSDGSLAEVWLKDYIDDIMGEDTCTIIDPYI